MFGPATRNCGEWGGPRWRKRGREHANQREEESSIPSQFSVSSSSSISFLPLFSTETPPPSPLTDHTQSSPFCSLLVNQFWVSDSPEFHHNLWDPCTYGINRESANPSLGLVNNKTVLLSHSDSLFPLNSLVSHLLLLPFFTGLFIGGSSSSFLSPFSVRPLSTHLLYLFLISHFRDGSDAKSSGRNGLHTFQSIFSPFSLLAASIYFELRYLALISSSIRALFSVTIIIVARMSRSQSPVRCSDVVEAAAAAADADAAQVRDTVA